MCYDFRLTLTLTTLCDSHPCCPETCCSHDIGAWRCGLVSTQLFALHWEDVLNVELPVVNKHLLNHSCRFSSTWMCLLSTCSVISADFASHNVYIYGFGWKMADVFVIWIPCFYIQHYLEAAVVIVCLCVHVFFFFPGYATPQADCKPNSQREGLISDPHTLLLLCPSLSPWRQEAMSLRKMFWSTCIR